MTASVAGRAFLLAAFAGIALSSTSASAGGCFGSECYRRVVTPPLFDTVTEQRLVSPQRTVYRTTPPIYDTVSERVLVAPGGRRWQTRYDAYGHVIGCWVEIPPRFSVATRRVLVQPATVVPETLPPVYASYSRRVLVQPGGAAWVPLHGGYGAGYGSGYGPVGYGVGSIPDRFGITGASSADIGVGLGLSHGSIYDGY